MEGVELPWRGPGAGRPGLPLPPGRMPLRREGQTRKRWRYVALFAEGLMLCAARAQIGPATQSFWVFWDREGRRQLSHASLRPGSREVRMDGPGEVGADSTVEIDARGLRATLRLGDATAVESICPSSGGSGWGWTRKRAGLPVEATVEIPSRSWRLGGFGVDDESAGYHQRHTRWSWSAGVGRAADGRPLAWNLVAGVNDPPQRSERGIWVDGDPHEPPPVAFDDIDAITIPGGDSLAFSPESKHRRDENFLLVRSRYRHSFGSFRGRLAGLDLASGLGVMEQHEARW